MAKIDKKIIAKYYGNKFLKYGDTPKGVDWKDKESQLTRFKSFDHLFVDSKNFSVLDCGCGKGDHFLFLKKNKKIQRYYGIDISQEMISFCKNKFAKQKNCFFSTKMSDVKGQVDYIVASGTFTVKHGFGQEKWLEYVLEEVDKLYKKAKKGVGFNLMTSYVDFKNEKLFYVNPEKMLKEMIKKYRYVDIIHSYELYEYTVLIRKP